MLVNRHSRTGKRIQFRIPNASIAQLTVVGGARIRVATTGSIEAVSLAICSARHDGIQDVFIISKVVCRRKNFFVRVPSGNYEHC